MSGRIENQIMGLIQSERRSYQYPLRMLGMYFGLTFAIILGVIHSAWHLPLMSHYNTTFGWYLFNLIPLTFVLNWFYLRSRASVIPVMLLHAGTNVIGNFFPTPMALLGGLGTDIVLRGLVYWLMADVLVIMTRGRLGWESKAVDQTETAAAI